MKTEDKIKEYVNLEIRQREIMDSLSIPDAIMLFFALTEKGIKP